MKRLKRYKPLFMQIGIFLLLISLTLFVIEHQKKFLTVDFSKHYSPNRTIEISGFEEGELWRGNYSYDSQRALEGKSSITFSSWYGAQNSITLEEAVTLNDGYSKGYVSLFILDKKNLLSITTLQLTLSGEKDSEKVYDLIPQLHLGWNRVPVLIPDWKRINSVTFTITSTLGSIAEVNLDRFWIENTSGYTSDIITTKSPSVSLRTIGERTYIFFASLDEESFTFNNPSRIDRGSITLSLIPEHAKNIALSLNSTSMRLAGSEMKQCIVYKGTTDVAEKTLTSTSAGNNLYVFLKAEIKNNVIVYSLSNNGVDFEECGTAEMTIKTLPQLTLNGSYLIDSYSAQY